MPNAAVSPDEAILTFKIDNKQPVELLDLSNALESLAGQYRRYLESHPDESVSADARLYIKEIKAGSIEAQLVEHAQFIIPHIEATVTILGFAKHLKQVFDYFSAVAGILKPKMERIDYEQVSNILNPVAKDSGSQFNITATHGGNVIVNLNRDSTSANAIQKRMERSLSQEKLPQHGQYDKVLLYWHKTKNSPKKISGDWAVVESIIPKAVKTVFQDDGDKAKILTEPLYARAYVVDLVVETVGGNPALYRILRVYESIPRPDQSPKKRHRTIKQKLI